MPEPTLRNILADKFAGAFDVGSRYQVLSRGHEAFHEACLLHSQQAGSALHPRLQFCDPVSHYTVSY